MQEITKIKNADWTPKYIVYIAPVLMMSMMINQFMNLKTFDLFGLSLVTSIITYPISLITCDILTEVYGYKRTRRLIYVCLGLVVVTMLFLQAAVYMPPAAEYTNNDAFKMMFNQLPRLALASIVGYFTGELLNAFIMSRLKSKTEGKYFYFRALFSTGFSQIISGMIFFVVAFAGVMSMQAMINSTLICVGLNLLYEVFFLPFTYLITQKLKALEGVDYFDR